MKKSEIVARSRGELAPTPRTRIARVIPASVLPRRPVVHTVRAWLRELFSPPPPESFLSPSEHVLISTRMHWLVPLRTIGQAAIAMPLAGLLLWVLNSIAPGMVLLQVLLGLGAVFHQVWLGYIVLLWRADHIIVTDKRLIRVSGLFTTTVDAIHLPQITDTAYHRSLLGRILNYGSLRIESAGRQMTKRRSRGDGGLHWDEPRQRWIATASLGHAPNGKRIVKRGSGKTKAAAKAKLAEVLRDHDDGLAIAPTGYTVENAVKDWLSYGLSGRDKGTVSTCTILSNTHIVPSLGARKLRDLSAEDVERWLADKATTLSTRTLQGLHSCLNRSVKRAMARDKVKRNVVALCSVPKGQPGRPSKALTMAQAEAVLAAAEHTRMRAYVVLSLLTGARTEELRALTWDHVDSKGKPDENPPVPPHVAVWRSVRAGADTKTRKSRRTLALPSRCVAALEEQRRQQEQDRVAAGPRWQEHGLVFASRVGTPLDPSHIRREFRRSIRGAAGLDPDEWTPRELRHSFVCLLSDNGVPLEEISRLVGHSSTAVTELVYRKQIRPVLQRGATTMDRIFSVAGPNSSARFTQ